MDFFKGGIVGRGRKHNRRNADVSSRTTGTGRSFARSWLHGFTLIALGAVATFAIMTSLEGSARRAVTAQPGGNASPFHSPNQPAVNSVRASGPRTVWQLLALPDSELEKVDVVELNLAVARAIPGLEDLDIANYQRIVDGWANDIRPRLPEAELAFAQTPEKWQNDVRFFRLGVVASYLNEHIGITYIDEQKQAQIKARKTGEPVEIRYTDPDELFIHDLIDNKRGTCGNMPTLHVAMGRRLGWPVALAAVKAHTVCRFDDGEVIYNIETTHTEQGGMFSAGTDEDYQKQFNLPKRAITSGSDLHSMTARQMLGYFIALRARHFADIGRLNLADRDYALARSLLPNHRKTWQAAMKIASLKGTELFNPGEPEGPSGLAYWLNRQFAQRPTTGQVSMQDRIDAVERINAINRMRMQQLQTPGIPGQPIPGVPVHPYAPTFPHHTGQHQPTNPHDYPRSASP